MNNKRPMRSDTAGSTPAGGLLFRKVLLSEEQQHKPIFISESEDFIMKTQKILLDVINLFGVSDVVTKYAVDLLASVEEEIESGTEVTMKLLLHGAYDWGNYSWSGMSLTDDKEISERFHKKMDYDDLLNEQAECLEVAADAIVSVA